MGKKILIVVLVVSLLANAYLFSTSQAQSAQVETAAELTKNLHSYFTSVGFNCEASYTDVEQTAECLETLRGKQTGIDSLVQSDYENADEDQSGYVVLRNEGSESFNSSQFTLFRNREVTDQRCSIEGRIEEGYTCRLDFETRCEPGGVLEVQYNGSRVFLENC